MQKKVNSLRRITMGEVVLFAFVLFVFYIIAVLTETIVELM